MQAGLNTPAKYASTSLTLNEAPSPHKGRQVTPLRPKERTTVEALTSTVSLLSRHASSGLSTLSSAATSRGLPSVKVWSGNKEDAQAQAPNVTSADHRQQDLASLKDAASTINAEWLSNSPSPIFQAMGGNRPEAAVHQDIFTEQLSRLADAVDPRETITWTSFDWFPAGTVAATPQRALIIAYASGGLQIYSLGHVGDTLSEVLNFQQILLPGDRVAGRVLAAKLQQPAPQQCRLLLVTHGDESDQPYILSTCSLQSQMVDQVTLLTQPAEAPVSAVYRTASIQLTQQYLIIGQSHPPVIHILDSRTLQAIRPSLTDVSYPSATACAPPPFHLSGRCLVYASSSKSGDIASRPSPLSANRHVGTTRQVGHRQPFSPGSEQQKLDAEQMRVAAIEMGAQASDMAKRVGSGLRAGIKTVGDWGTPYLSNRVVSDPTESPRNDAKQQSPCSAQELPLTSPQGNIHKPSATDRGSGSTETSPGQAVHSTICLVDLSGADVPSVAQVPYRGNGIACLKLDPSGSLIFVADQLGHKFDIYELRSQPACMRPSKKSPSSRAVHRFKLLRGVTAAQVCDVTWSAQSQWVGILTRTGTVHVYALGPLHGLLARPIGSTITPFARTPRPALPERLQPEGLSSAYSGTPPVTDNKIQSKANSSALPAATFVDGYSLVPLVDGQGRALDVLCFHPALGVLILSRITSPADSTTSLEAMRGTVAAAGGTAAAVASHHVSGLTAMMRWTSSSGGTPKPPPPVASGQTSAEKPRRPQRGLCKAVAVWNELTRAKDAPEVRPVSVSTLEPTASRSGIYRPTRGWVSQAEVETYDRTPRALVAPLYISHQFRFNTWRHSPDTPVRSEAVLVDISRAKLDPLEVRETVQVTAGQDDATPSDGDLSFDAGLTSAITARGFSPRDVLARSPSSCIPSFPQGQSARRPNWKSSVVSGIGVPRRLGSAAGREVASITRKRASPGSLTSRARSEQGQSLSFDEDVSYDAYLFATAREAQPSPNGGAAAPIGPSSRSGEPHSFQSARGASLSPFARSATGVLTPEGGSSAETPLTAASDEACEQRAECDLNFDDEDEDADQDGQHGVWAAARGIQEDVEGDDLGWDCFPDSEFGGNGWKQQQQQQRSSGGDGPPRVIVAAPRLQQGESAEDFLIGGLALDEDVSIGATDVLPPFARKVDTTATKQTKGSVAQLSSKAESPPSLAGLATHRNDREIATATTKSAKPAATFAPVSSIPMTSSSLVSTPTLGTTPGGFMMPRPSSTTPIASSAMANKPSSSPSGLAPRMSATNGRLSSSPASSSSSTTSSGARKGKGK